MGRAEFVALVATMLATVAFSIDAMLPALPQIGAELSPQRIENAPLILTLFLLGMGLGTFITGPLSDAYGRKPVILTFSALYILGAALAWASQSLEMLLAARLLQGFGAAGPRVVALAVVRDRFSGRQMAQVVSVVMMIFTLVPAFAPLLGDFIVAWTGWRGIFAAFIVFSMFYCAWVLLRLPETLPPAARRPLQLPLIRAAIAEILRHPVVRISVLTQMLVSAMLFVTLMLVQQIYDLVYDRGAAFAVWFFGVAIVGGLASLLNAVLVVRIGMQRLIVAALGIQVALSGAFILFDLGGGALGFYWFVLWQTMIFCQAALTIGNLNALAMEPMGHIAGTAASVMSALATVGAVVVAGPIGAMFNGSERVLIGAVLVMAVVALIAMLTLKRTPRVTL